MEINLDPTAARAVKPRHFGRFLLATLYGAFGAVGLYGFLVGFETDIGWLARVGIGAAGFLLCALAAGFVVRTRIALRAAVWLHVGLLLLIAGVAAKSLVEGATVESMLRKSLPAFGFQGALVAYLRSAPLVASFRRPGLP